MNILNKISESNFRKIFTFITLFCLVFEILVLVKTMFTDRVIKLGYSLKSENKGQKIEKGFFVYSVNEVVALFDLERMIVRICSAGIIL